MPWGAGRAARRAAAEDNLGGRSSEKTDRRFPSERVRRRDPAGSWALSEAAGGEKWQVKGWR